MEVQLSTMATGTGTLESKLTELEAADVFLQETHRQLAVRTTDVETKANSIEDDVTRLLKDHEEGFNLKLEGRLESINEDLDILNKNRANVDDSLTHIITRLNGHEDSIKELDEDTASIKITLAELSSRTDQTQTNITSINENIANIDLKFTENANNITQNIDALNKANMERFDKEISIFSEQFTNISNSS